MLFRSPPDMAGVNSHHDAGFLTLLLQHEVPGLQVQDADGQWADVPLIDGAIVVNLGEMLQSMTGNYLVATTHRVVTREPRFSSAYFHGPDLRAGLEPLDLGSRFVDAVASSPRHRDAGFMARREELQIFSQPCPLLVPLVEEGWNNRPVTRQILREYLRPLLRHRIDTLVLGCTHYPLLKTAIREIGRAHV